MRVFLSIFPGAQVLMFGYGKRTFLTARVDRWSDLIMGPLPGPGAVEVAALKVTPDKAFSGQPASKPMQRLPARHPAWELSRA